MIETKFVCSTHISDRIIRQYINSSSTKVDQCYYCKSQRKKKVISVQDLVEYIVTKLETDFSVSDLVAPSALTVLSKEELFDYLKLDIDNSDFRSDLLQILPEKDWAIPQNDKKSQGEEMYAEWETFKDIVMHRSRYSFFFRDNYKYEEYSLNIAATLKKIVKLITQYGLVKPLKSNVELFRCRQHAQILNVHDASAICAPPKQFTSFSNRMSPSGISMFYAAFDPRTAFRETIEQEELSKPYFSVAAFRVKSQIDVIDFTYLPPIPSRLDTKRAKDIESIVFLRKFIQDLSQPVEKDGKDHIEYIPTQIITEYIRFFFSKSRKLRVGGIIYSSTRHEGKKACVLFMDSKECLDKLILDRYLQSSRKIGEQSAMFG